MSVFNFFVSLRTLFVHKSFTFKHSARLRSSLFYCFFLGSYLRISPSIYNSSSIIFIIIILCLICLIIFCLISELILSLLVLSISLALFTSCTRYVYSVYLVLKLFSLAIDRLVCMPLNWWLEELLFNSFLFSLNLTECFLLSIIAGDRYIALSELLCATPYLFLLYLLLYW